MNQLIKLHTGLFNYLKIELPKRKNLNELIKFLLSLFKIYFKELLKIYKQLFLYFDPEYKKQRKQYNNYQRIKVDLERALKMLQYIDKKMFKAGMNRHQRRNFWREFYKDGQVRKEVFDNLLKEIERIG